MKAYGEKMFFRQWLSPLGALTFVSTAKGLCAVEFGSFSENEEALNRWAKKWWGGAEWIRDEKALDAAVEQVNEYFAGRRRNFRLPLDLRGTPFQIRVWNALLDIPFGQTVSYKEIAEKVGNVKATRAIGGANHVNPLPIVVPCHRVIGSDGDLVGYGGGLHIKKFLLDLENRFCTNGVCS